MGKRLKIVIEVGTPPVETTYYVTTLEQISLNMNSGTPYIETGSLTGLTENIDEATDFTDAQALDAKKVYPDFIIESYTAPSAVGQLASHSLWIGSIAPTVSVVKPVRVVANYQTEPEVIVGVETTGVGTATVSLTEGGTYGASVNVPVVDGQVYALVYVKATGGGGVADSLQEATITLANAVDIFDTITGAFVNEHA